MDKKYLIKQDLKEIFLNLNIKQNDVVIVHCSLKKIGYIVGGAQTLVDALLETLTEEGTLIVPYQRVDNTEPSRWENPGIEPEFCKYVRDNFPAFDLNASEDYKMGALIKNMRIRKKLEISSHPVDAFIAIGKMAKFICNFQSLDFPLGAMSPLIRMCDLKAKTLLLGVEYDCATIMHLGEHLSQSIPYTLENSMIKSDSQTVRKKYLDIDMNSDEFNQIGNIMELKGKVNKLEFNNCTFKMFDCKEAVEFSQKYFENKLKYYSFKEEL